MTDIATTPLTYNSYVLQIATMAVVGTTVVGGTQVPIGSLVVGTKYRIGFVGTSDFTTVGAASNSVGALFTATGTGTGSGYAVINGIVAGVNASFNELIPQMLNYAELRIQRDLDLQNLEVVRSSYSLPVGEHILNIPSNDFVTVETVVLFNGTNSCPVLPASKDYINNVYTDSSFTGVPSVFCMYGGDPTTSGSTHINILFGPRADTTYTVQLTGLARALTLYAYANSTQADTQYTLISSQLPDLMIMASMIYISAFQRNFGKANDDPQMAITYESQYQALLKSASDEEYRKKFEASAWTSYSNSPAASPSRG